LSIGKEEYIEECCPLKKPNETVRIPINRLMEKLDELLGKKEYEACKRHLDYWLSEAELNGDEKGKLAVLNEKIGLYRKLNELEASISFGIEAVALAEAIGLADSATMGTTFLNLATAYKAAGQNELSFEYYEKAKVLYDKYLNPHDYKLAGLNNNSGLCLMDLGRHEKARESFEKALEILSFGKGNEPDMAITYCNLAENEEKALGLLEAEKLIEEYLDRARELLLSDGVSQDYYLAYVLEKCAGVFAYYGYFIDEKEMQRRAFEIREGY